MLFGKVKLDPLHVLLGPCGRMTTKTKNSTVLCIINRTVVIYHSKRPRKCIYINSEKLLLAISIFSSSNDKPLTRQHYFSAIYRQQPGVVKFVISQISGFTSIWFYVHCVEWEKPFTPSVQYSLPPRRKFSLVNLKSHFLFSHFRM